MPVGPRAQRATPPRIGKRVETSVGRFEAELRMAAEKGFDHVVGFLRLEAARTVDQQTIGSHRTAHPVEEFLLKTGGAGHVFGAPSPFDLRSAANGSETGARRVEEDTREPAGPCPPRISRIVERRLHAGKT
jgi:hypothetical protein